MQKRRRHPPRDWLKVLTITQFAILAIGLLGWVLVAMHGEKQKRILLSE
jgi:preprotein translocase subunit Sss1